MLKSVETLGVYALNHIGTLALRELELGLFSCVQVDAF